MCKTISLEERLGFTICVCNYDPLSCKSYFVFDHSYKGQGILDEKSQQCTISSFDSIVYVLSHAIKMKLFWSPMGANDMLPHVPTFNYLRYEFYFNFEAI
jgi:hypothetical protein